MVLQTKKKVTIEYGEKELSIIRAALALEDLDNSSNVLFEHVREWYHAFFPELERTVNDPEVYLKLVYEIGNKKEYSKQKIGEITSDETLQEKIKKAAEESIGSSPDEQSLSEIKLLALNALNLKTERSALEQLIETQMKKQSPNFSQLAGPVLGARLLSKAGSFKRLAQMPASTVQVLGAEKALFRHLKTKRKTRGPKYGFLFAHPLVKQLPPGHKGKMARSLASKLSIAVKTDVYGNHSSVADALQQQLSKRFEELQKAPAKPRAPLPTREFQQNPKPHHYSGKKPFFKHKKY